VARYRTRPAPEDMIKRRAGAIGIAGRQSVAHAAAPGEHPLPQGHVVVDLEAARKGALGGFEGGYRVELEIDGKVVEAGIIEGLAIAGDGQRPYRAVGIVVAMDSAPAVGCPDTDPAVRSADGDHSRIGGYRAGDHRPVIGLEFV